MAHGLPDFWSAYNERPTPSAAVSAKRKPVDPEASVTLFEVKVPGKLKWLQLTATDPDMAFRVIADAHGLGPLYPAPTDERKQLQLVPREWNDQVAGVGDGQGVVLTKYDTTANIYTFIVVLPLEWSSSFTVKAFNFGAAKAYAFASALYVQ